MTSVIIFDGVCHLCNASVDFVMKRDQKRMFRYTANQMEAGQKILRDNGINPDQIETVYLYENGTLYDKSSAALRIARKLGFPYNLAFGFIIVPAFIRNIVYNLIAKNRYKWFGKKETCRLPTAEERSLFLD